MAQAIRVVHYVNQFFGGIGGEEKAHVTPQVHDGPLGPGRGLEKVLGDQGNVVGTVVCGDNYFAEHTEKAVNDILAMIRSYHPDLVIAGPAFNAGRYGVACGEVCKAAQDQLNIPAITAMFEENPGVDLSHSDVYIVKTDESVRGMNDALTKMVSIGVRLVYAEKIGKPAEEGYFPRGIINNEFMEKNAAERAVDMLLAKIREESYTPELEVPKFDQINPAPPVKDLAAAAVAFVTDGGLVPKGNPDKMEAHRSTRFASYSIEGLDTFSAETFEANHMGYDTTLVCQDPNRLVPLDVARDLEKEGIIGKIHGKVYTTAGVATPLHNCRKMGQEIAKQLNQEGVNAVILTST